MSEDNQTKIFLDMHELRLLGRVIDLIDLGFRSVHLARVYGCNYRRSVRLVERHVFQGRGW